MLLLVCFHCIKEGLCNLQPWYQLQNISPYDFLLWIFYHGACASTFASPEGFPFPCYPDRKALSAQPIYKRHCSSWNHFMLYLNRVSVMGIPPTMKQVCLIPLKGFSAICLFLVMILARPTSNHEEVSSQCWHKEKTVSIKLQVFFSFDFFTIIHGCVIQNFCVRNIICFYIFHFC